MADDVDDEIGQVFPTEKCKVIISDFDIENEDTGLYNDEDDDFASVFEASDLTSDYHKLLRQPRDINNNGNLLMVPICPPYTLPPPTLPTFVQSPLRLGVTTRSHHKPQALSGLETVSTRRYGDYLDVYDRRGSPVPPKYPDLSSPVPMKFKVLDVKVENDLSMELNISNLDNTFDLQEMQRIITNLFNQCGINFSSVRVYYQTDGNTSAVVKVDSAGDAKLAISQIHRKRIGVRKVSVSYRHTSANSQKPGLLRSQVVALLSDVPNNRIPLIKFREMFEKRYNTKVGQSELQKMKDVIAITENCGGRSISLLATPSSTDQTTEACWRSRIEDGIVQSLATGLPTSQTDPNSSFGSNEWQNNASMNSAAGKLLLESLPCPKHFPVISNHECWADQEFITQLPVVKISVVVLENNMEKLIKDHNGSVPLSSLVYCYEDQFEPLEIVSPEEGVPLEHLVSCIPNVSINVGASEKKRIVFTNLSNLKVPSFVLNGDATITTENDSFRRGNRRHLSPYISFNNMSTNPSLNSPCANPLAGALSSFARETTELLKAAPGCRIPFQKFIPNYHHRFGRQCRVSEYGYTKLKDLLIAISHVVQIMGEGNRLLLTLTHKAQVKRFTAELLKLLRNQPGKQVELNELEGLFEKSNGKKFTIIDYGVCYIEDMIHMLPHSTVQVTIRSNGGTSSMIVLSLPQREQTPEDIQRLSVFANECYEILQHDQECTINFNKFIPAYHHHFGRQCRVYEYGFMKLIELFESIPEMLEIYEDEEGERHIQLTDKQRLQVVGERIVRLIVDNYQVISKKPEDIVDEISCCEYGDNILNSISCGELSLDKPNHNIAMRLTEVISLYLQKFGSHLRPENYGCQSVPQLIAGKLTSKLILDVVSHSWNKSVDYIVRVVDQKFLCHLMTSFRHWLEGTENGEMLWTEFARRFRKSFDTPITCISQWRQCFEKQIEFPADEDLDDRRHSDSTVLNQGLCSGFGVGSTEFNPASVRLTALYMFARKIGKILETSGGMMILQDLEISIASTQKYLPTQSSGASSIYVSLGYVNLHALLKDIPDVAALKEGLGKKSSILVTRITSNQSSNSASSISLPSPSVDFISSTPTKFLSHYAAKKFNDAYSDKCIYSQNLLVSNEGSPFDDEISSSRNSIEKESPISPEDQVSYVGNNVQQIGLQPQFMQSNVSSDNFLSSSSNGYIYCKPPPKIVLSPRRMVSSDAMGCQTSFVGKSAISSGESSLIQMYSLEAPWPPVSCPEEHYPNQIGVSREARNDTMTIFGRQVAVTPPMIDSTWPAFCLENLPSGKDYESTTTIEASQYYKTLRNVDQTLNILKISQLMNDDTDEDTNETEQDSGFISQELILNVEY